MNRRAFLGAALGGAACAAREEQSARAVRRGVEYLRSRQERDGGWHSATYGLLRSGQSLTPLVLNALLDAGAGGATEAAVRFLERNVNGDGALGLSDDAAADYPCYATALAVRALVRTGAKGKVGRTVEWLRGQQMAEGNGWEPADAAFGAWGIGGERRRRPDSGHVDLSMTRHVLEALRDAGVGPQDAAMRAAGVFVRRCRNVDGSFFFSTVELGANKAGEEGDGFKGYGTATADGVLSLIAIGGDAARPMEWLRANDHAELPAGFEAEARRRYAEGLRYYYADAAVRAFRSAGMRRRAGFAEALVARQREDGSWANEEVLVKEDDPLIATAFAVSALAL